MGLHEMLRTLDSEELTLQMAYDLLEQEEVAAAQRAAHDPFAPPPRLPPVPSRLMDGDRLFAKLESLVNAWPTP
jgi:hypothetical protein